MAGFKSETEHGVRSAFSDLAKIAGVALGAGAAFEFGKSAVEDAANIQKSAETIRLEFGKAGEGLLAFANDGGTALGAINTNTDATSAKLGALFRNMGIGKKAAAEMTQNWEKLALAFNATSGGGSGGAGAILQQLQSAAISGSARGLRNLGLDFNTAQVQVAAFKLGLTQTITQALLPAQRSIAVYSLAMTHLPSLLASATAHSGDLADVQARLTAVWAKAKETLGNALLPEVTKLAKEFSHWLSTMEKTGQLQRDFNAAARITASVLKGIATAVHLGIDAWHLLTGAVGGAKNAAILFFAVMAVANIRALASTIIGTLVRNAFVQLQVATTEEQAAYLTAFGTMEIATIGLASTIKAALISTGIGALVVAAGIAATLIITHWNTVKRWIVEFAHWIVSHALFIPIVGEVIFVVSEIVKHWNGLKQVFWDFVHFFGTVFTHPIRAVQTLFTQLWSAIKSGLAGLVNGFVDQLNHIINAYNAVAGWLTGNIPAIGHIGAQAGKAYGDQFNKAASDAMKGPEGPLGPLTSASKDAGKQLAKAVVDGVGDGVRASLDATARKLSAALQTAIDSAHKAIESSVRSAKDNLDKIGQDLAKTIEQIQAKIGGSAGAIAGSPQGQAFAKLKKLIESGAPSFEIARARNDLASQLQNVGKQQKPKVATDLANLTATFDKGKIGYAQFEARLHKILREDGITMAQALKAGGPAFADAFKAQVAALGQQAQAIAALPARYRGIGGAGGAADIKIIRPLQVIREQDAKIAGAAARQRAEQLKVSEKANATLQAIHSTQLSSNPLPGYGKQPKGNGSHQARVGAAIGFRG